MTMSVAHGNPVLHALEAIGGDKDLAYTPAAVDTEPSSVPASVFRPSPAE